MLTMNCGNITKPDSGGGGGGGGGPNDTSPVYWNTGSNIGWIFYNEQSLQVRKLRENISDLKVQVSSITKGIPISQWDILAGR